MVKIVIVSPEETWPIRHKVMWPDQPLNFVKLANDNDGQHFGLFIDEKLVSVVSLFIENNEAQFRKFATLHEYQGQGYGSQLLNQIIRIAEQKKLSRIWCNARVTKIDYYTKFRMQQTESTFKKAGVDYVIMERNFH